jgi:hypothetical protein
MATDNRKHGKPAQAEATEQLERMSEAGGAVADAMAKWTQVCLDGMTQLNGEVFGFVNDRLRRDVDLGQSLARCSNWAEAASLQQDWARRAMQDYFSESSKLLQLMSKTTLEGLDPVLRTAARNISGLVQPLSETRKR